MPKIELRVICLKTHAWTGVIETRKHFVFNMFAAFMLTLLRCEKRKKARKISCGYKQKSVNFTDV